MTRSIAVLGGTGPEGFGLARRWAKAGEKIIIGSRDAKRARAAAEKITASIEDAQVSGDENIVACAAADLVVLTIPFEGHAPLLKQIKPVIRADAAQSVRMLAAKIPGVRAIDGGKLENARILERITALLIGLNIRHKGHSGIRITGLPDQAYNS